MGKGGIVYGMNAIFIIGILLAVSQKINCSSESEEGETLSRNKRDYHNYNSPPSNYQNSNYDGNYAPNDCNYDDQFKKCKTPMKCIAPVLIPNQDDPVKSNRTWLNTARTFYLTIGSCWGYSQFANILLGREVRTERELKEMCMTQYFAVLGSTFNNGYGRQFEQFCTADAIGDMGQDCPTVPGSGSDGTDISLLETETDYLILTDSKTYALYYRCVNGRYADYMLSTTRTYVERSVVAAVLDVIQAMGFDLSEVRLLPCLSPTYPSPFQNYISDSCPSNSNSYGGSYSGTCNSNNQGSYPPSYSPPQPPPQSNNHPQYY